MRLHSATVQGESADGNQPVLLLERRHHANTPQIACWNKGLAVLASLVAEAWILRSLVGFPLTCPVRLFIDKRSLIVAADTPLLEWEVAGGLWKKDGYE